MDEICYKIADKNRVFFLFSLCWLVYFSTYIGRLNYSAGLSEIIRAEGFSKGQAGMIGTGFFFAYGVGQLISGFLGDRLSPKKMVLTGMSVSGICNLAMAAAHDPGTMAGLWCFNGLFQSFIWSPMIRLMYEYYQTETRMRACVSLNSSVPVGTMAAYGVTAAVIWLSGWRMMFVLSGAVLLAVSALWAAGMSYVERYAVNHGIPEAVKPPGGVRNQKGEKGRDRIGFKSLILESGFLFLMIALFVQGALKDGVTTWVPTYISETYGVSAIIAITTTMIIPVFNLAGVFLASYANSHWFRNEVCTAGAFFAVCAAALLILRLSSGKNMAASYLMLAMATTAMMAVNTMLIAVLPSYFGVLGRASSVSGLLNSSVYAGGAVSTYGIGTLSVSFGWNHTILIWFLLAVVSMGLCLLVVKRWIIYRRSILESNKKEM